jgi:hypothetical protein
MCTISMVALAADIEEAKALVSGAEVAMPVMVEAISKLSKLGDFDTFLKTLQSNPYWNSILQSPPNDSLLQTFLSDLKAAGLAAGLTIYEDFRACFMGMQNALQGTAGAAGMAFGQWLRSVIATPQTNGGGGAG